MCYKKYFKYGLTLEVDMHDLNFFARKVATRHGFCPKCGTRSLVSSCPGSMADTSVQSPWKNKNKHSSNSKLTEIWRYWSTKSVVLSPWKSISSMLHMNISTFLLLAKDSFWIDVVEYLLLSIVLFVGRYSIEKTTMLTKYVEPRYANPRRSSFSISTIDKEFVQHLHFMELMRVFIPTIRHPSIFGVEVVEAPGIISAVLSLFFLSCPFST